ncbi:hypothetical protein MMARV_C057P1 [viral metagenome]|uniref:Uncharacterized protein n=1 Tax=viral metagenome TaxID=1070528 RepID=A0A6L2ZKM9_9ZZZZ
MSQKTESVTRFLNRREKTEVNRLPVDKSREAFEKFASAGGSPGAVERIFCEYCRCAAETAHPCTYSLDSEKSMMPGAWIGDAVLLLDLRLLCSTEERVDNNKVQMLSKASTLKAFLCTKLEDVEGKSDHWVSSKMEVDYIGKYREEFITLHFGAEGWARLKERWKILTPK